MNSFVSYRETLRPLLRTWIASDELHAKWLNTLSYMENCGAKAIAAFEHPTRVSSEVLKHAAEEFRHAYYLKSQISRLLSPGYPDYRIGYILGGYASRHYLHRLNVAICRHLLNVCSKREDVFKEMAYLLVTYAIERRAQELYEEYQTLLKETGSWVSVIGILRDEVGHLEEMQQQLNRLPDGWELGRVSVGLESALCADWLGALSCKEGAAVSGCGNESLRVGVLGSVKELLGA